MCTAISYNAIHHYFGRNLDLEYTYSESVVVTPRNYFLKFKHQEAINKHFAMIGMATVVNDYPLYYEATNDVGLSAAALNFPGNAVYKPYDPNKINVTSYEFIPYILSKFESTKSVLEILENINITSCSFSDNYPHSPLHWLISDKEQSIVIEPLESGIKVYDNPIGILTNNPPFDFHMYHLSNYLNLTREEPVNRFSSQINLAPYSRGMGSIGLPGDPSSSSRFIKATFTKFNVLPGDSVNQNINQFFHILSSVEQQEGCVITNGKFEKTVYSCCCDSDTGIYYYKTYENSHISAIQMHRVNLQQKKLISFPLIKEQQIQYVNQ